MKHHEIFEEVAEYAVRANVKPETVFRNATGNPRLMGRLAARMALVERDVEAVRSYMDSNPVTASSAEAP